MGNRRKYSIAHSFCEALSCMITNGLATSALSARKLSQELNGKEVEWVQNRLLCLQGGVTILSLLRNKTRFPGLQDYTVVTIMTALSWFTPYPMAKHFHLTLKDPSVISSQNTRDIVCLVSGKGTCDRRHNIQLLQMVSSGVCAQFMKIQDSVSCSMFCVKEGFLSFETARNEDQVCRFSPSNIRVRQKRRKKHKTCICSCEKRKIPLLQHQNPSCVAERHSF